MDTNNLLVLEDLGSPSRVFTFRGKVALAIEYRKNMRKTALEARIVRLKISEIFDRAARVKYLGDFRISNFIEGK